LFRENAGNVWLGNYFSLTLSADGRREGFIKMKKGTQGIIFAATLAVIMGYGITAYAQKSASSAKKTDNSAKTEAVYK